MLPDTNTIARHSTDADDLSVLVMSRGKNEEISKDIRRYEPVSGVKINCINLWACGWIHRKIVSCLVPSVS